jgi:hypothetical protein
MSRSLVSSGGPCSSLLRVLCCRCVACCSPPGLYSPSDELVVIEARCRLGFERRVDAAISRTHSHPCLLCRARKDAECESLPRVLLREEGYSPLFVDASRVKLVSGFETPTQVATSCGHDHNRLTAFSCVVVTEGHEQLIPFPGTVSRSMPIRYLPPSLLNGTCKRSTNSPIYIVAGKDPNLRATCPVLFVFQ